MDRLPTFVAIDFETADNNRDSACAVALVRVESGVVVERAHALIRPPRRQFTLTRIHGISWHQVADQPTFRDAWPRLIPMFAGANFLAAHNASFDRSVLAACCQAAKMPVPALPFQCTMALARRTWNLFPTKLPDVCAFLNLPLRHHDPRSDAEACAGIMLHVLRRATTPASNNSDRAPRTVEPRTGP